jgi:hypothetical protein
MTENQLEQDALGWLAEVGYATLYGPNLAPDGDSRERSNYQQVVLGAFAFRNFPAKTRQFRLRRGNMLCSRC